MVGQPASSSRKNSSVRDSWTDLLIYLERRVNCLFKTSRRVGMEEGTALNLTSLWKQNGST